MRGTLLRELIIFILLMLVTTGIALALSAEEITSSFRKEYETVKNFNADFEETTIIADRKRTARGKLNFQKPDLLRLEYIDPSDPKNITQVVISDGKAFWSYTALIKQVTKQKLAQDGSRMELLPGFGKSLENVEKNYSLSLVEDKLAEKSGVHVVELTPKSHIADTGTVFDILRVWVRDEDSALIQFMYKNVKNETTYVLSFKNIKVNENLDESIFKFEVPKGTQVIAIPSR